MVSKNKTCLADVKTINLEFDLSDETHKEFILKYCQKYTKRTSEDLNSYYFEDIEEDFTHNLIKTFYARHRINYTGKEGKVQSFDTVNKKYNYFVENNMKISSTTLSKRVVDSKGKVLYKACSYLTVKKFLNDKGLSVNGRNIDKIDNVFETL